MAFVDINFDQRITDTHGEFDTCLNWHSNKQTIENGLITMRKASKNIPIHFVSQFIDEDKIEK
jgi:hypothetical protein